MDNCKRVFKEAEKVKENVLEYMSWMKYYEDCLNRFSEYFNQQLLRRYCYIHLELEFSPLIFMVENNVLDYFLDKYRDDRIVIEYLGLI